jgi:hypothetical protein
VRVRERGRDRERGKKGRVIEIECEESAEERERERNKDVGRESLMLVHFIFKLYVQFNTLKSTNYSTHINQTHTKQHTHIPC